MSMMVDDVRVMTVKKFCMANVDRLSICSSCLIEQKQSQSAHSAAAYQSFNCETVIAIGKEWGRHY